MVNHLNDRLHRIPCNAFSVVLVRSIGIAVRVILCLISVLVMGYHLVFFFHASDFRARFLKLLLFVQFQRIISKNREGNSGFSGYRRLEHNNISGELVSLIYSLSLAMVLEVSGKTIAFRSYKSD
ncbi:hypothetical protein ACLB2K_045468 [Fragaria x ananassa]